MTIDTWATLKIYLEYILPTLLLGGYITYIVVIDLGNKLKLYRLNKKHSIKKELQSTYWYIYRCEKCGKIIYKEPTSVNTSLSGVFFKVKIKDKCKENK